MYCVGTEVSFLLKRIVELSYIENKRICKQYVTIAKVVLAVAIAFIAGFSESFADNTYPYSYQIAEKYDGGFIQLASAKNSSGQPFSYFLRPNWTGESEVLFGWRGASDKYSRGVSIGNGVVEATTNLGQSLLVVWRENGAYFIGLADTNLEFKSIKQIPGIVWIPGLQAKFCGAVSENSQLLIVSGSLQRATVSGGSALEVSQVSESVSDAVSFYSERADKNADNFAVIVRREDYSIVYFYPSQSGAAVPSVRLPFISSCSPMPLGQRLALAVSGSANSSLVEIIDREHGLVNSSWIESKPECIVTVSEGDRHFLVSLNYGADASFRIDKTEIDRSGNFVAIKSEELGNQFIEPLGLAVVGESVYAVFRNGICSFSFDLSRSTSDFLPIGEYFHSMPVLDDYNGGLMMSGATVSILFEKDKHSLWMLNRAYRDFGKAAVPIGLGAILLLVIQLYRHQKRLLFAVLNLPTSGAVLVVDRHGRLQRANSSGKQLLGISESVPMNKPFGYYCSGDQSKEIKDLVEKALITKDTVQQKLNIMSGALVKEWFTNVTPLRNIAGQFRGLVFTGIDITAELEKKRLSNWAQLAHDMQTNLSTIKLNAELLEPTTENEADRRNKIIHQTNLLIRRVRDIVTVGRTDSADKKTENSTDLLSELLSEFDSAMFPLVEFKLAPKDFPVECDRLKLLRALRNAVENGIRSMPGQSGTITISSDCDERNAYFSIKDTGAGMDEKTKAKMLTPYFTTSKKHGGAGIGTMIMQHVAELHGGRIVVNSEQGVGTEIVFVIPSGRRQSAAKQRGSKQ